VTQPKIELILSNLRQPGTTEFAVDAKGSTVVERARKKN